MKGSATIQLRQIIVSNDQGHRLLLVEFAIHCDVCGETAGVIHGHHLRTLQQAIGQVIENHPDLCGDVGQVSEQLEFHGVNDPKKARLN